MASPTFEALTFGRDTTLHWRCSEGEHVLWVRPQHPLTMEPLQIVDFWELREGDAILLSNRVEDIEPVFPLHPLEVCNAAARWMQRRLAEAYEPADIIDYPNAWRVPGGDSLLRIPMDGGEGSSTVVRCDESLLVLGTPRDETLHGLMTFGESALETPSPTVARAIRRGVALVAGSPVQTLAFDWQIG